MRDRATPLVGINVSGLLFNAPDGGKAQYALRADYRRVIQGLIERLLDHTECRILLVPHVVTAPGHFESDITACLAVRDALRTRAPDRVFVQPAVRDPREAKWIISQLHWFCGTRMHATIAALSSGVPTAAIAYSGKTLGVFETCGQGAGVVDPRECDSAAAIDRLWHLYLTRTHVADTLAHARHGVIDQAQRQMQMIVDSIAPRSASIRSVEPVA